MLARAVVRARLETGNGSPDFCCVGCSDRVSPILNACRIWGHLEVSIKHGEARPLHPLLLLFGCIGQLADAHAASSNT